MNAVGAFLAEFAHFGSVERMGMAFVARGHHMHRVAFAGSVHPKTDAAVSAASAAAAGVAAGIVHTHAADAECAFGDAYPFLFLLALAAVDGCFAIVVTGAEYFFQPRGFIFCKVGILRNGGQGKNGK